MAQGRRKIIFDALPKEFKNKIIAENLGFLTKEVDELLKYTGFPGMKVLQFSFDSRDDNGKSLPDDFEKITLFIQVFTTMILFWVGAILPIKRRGLCYALSWSKG